MLVRHGRPGQVPRPTAWPRGYNGRKLSCPGDRCRKIVRFLTACVFSPITQRYVFDRALPQWSLDPGQRGGPHTGGATDIQVSVVKVSRFI
jgi:hypothetical protein